MIPINLAFTSGDPGSRACAGRNSTGSAAIPSGVSEDDCEMHWSFLGRGYLNSSDQEAWQGARITGLANEGVKGCLKRLRRRMRLAVEPG